jgi:hypothetical protein
VKEGIAHLSSGHLESREAAKRSLITLGAALAGKLKPLKAPKKKNEEVDEDEKIEVVSMGLD